jgi:hypothetical protein
MRCWVATGSRQRCPLTLEDDLVGLMDGFRGALIVLISGTGSVLAPRLAFDKGEAIGASLAKF